MPARKPQNGFGRHQIGAFSSIKLKRSILWESTIERDLFYLLDFDPEVISYEEQPLVIPYSLAGHAHTYTPDVLIQYGNGTEEIAECKPIAFLEEEAAKRQIAAGELYCRLNGKVYRVYTDVELRTGYYLENVKLLHKFARYEVPGAALEHVARLLKQGIGPLLIHELAAMLSPASPHEQLYVVLNLSYNHQLMTDLKREPLTSQSSVWFSNSEANAT